MQEVKIPDSPRPWTADINNSKYEYKESVTTEVPDEVAGLIRHNKSEEPSQGMYGYFYVYHSSMKGGGNGGRPDRVKITDRILEKGYDLTKTVPYGCTYGGYALESEVDKNDDPYVVNNWIWRSMQTASGQKLKPVKDAVYIVKELPYGFLRMGGANGRSGGKWISLYPFSGWDGFDDDDPGYYNINGHIIATEQMGFYIWKCGAGEKNGKNKCPCIASGKYGSWGTFAYFWGETTLYKLPAGMLSIGIIGLPSSFHQLPNVSSNDIYVIQPYVVTPDGVEVLGTERWVYFARDITISPCEGKATRINITSPTSFVPAS